SAVRKKLAGRSSSPGGSGSPPSAGRSARLFDFDLEGALRPQRELPLRRVRRRTSSMPSAPRSRLGMIAPLREAEPTVQLQPDGLSPPPVVVMPPSPDDPPDAPTLPPRPPDAGLTLPPVPAT